MELQDFLYIIAGIGIPSKDITISGGKTLDEKGVPTHIERYSVTIKKITFSYTDGLNNKLVNVSGIEIPRDKKIGTYGIYVPEDEKKQQNLNKSDDLSKTCIIETSEGLIWAMLAASGIDRESAENKFAVIHSGLINENLKRVNPYEGKPRTSQTDNQQLQEKLLSFDNSINPFPNFLTSNGVFVNAYPGTYNVSGRTRKNLNGVETHILKISDLQSGSYIEHEYNKKTTKYKMSYNDAIGEQAIIEHCRQDDEGTEFVTIQIGENFEVKYDLKNKAVLQAKGTRNNPESVEYEICNIIDQYLGVIQELSSPWTTKAKQR